MTMNKEFYPRGDVAQLFLGKMLEEGLLDVKMV